MINPKIKICCISSIKEANMAINAGASAIGLVSEMPSGPGVISEEKIEQITSSLSSSADTFLLTSNQDSKSIIEQLSKCKTRTVQIVDSVKTDVYSDIKKIFPDVNIVQVIHVNDETSVKEAIRLSEYVDALLLDSGNQKLSIKELGGTGRTHDWSLSKRIVDLVRVPVYLAGGINSDNILDAIRRVKPYGIDLCSSVRTNGKLDQNKLNELFTKLNVLH